MSKLQTPPASLLKSASPVCVAWLKYNPCIQYYYRKFGNFRCWNIFVVIQDYEIKYHEIFSTLNNRNNEIFAVRKLILAHARARTYHMPACSARSLSVFRVAPPLSLVISTPGLFRHSIKLAIFFTRSYYVFATKIQCKNIFIGGVVLQKILNTKIFITNI